VNETLDLLIKLQKLDSIIIKHSKTIKNIPSKINSMETPFKEAEATLERLNSNFENLDKKKREKENSVNENNDRAEKLKTRTNDIKDNKAYTAHLKEIDGLERSTRKLEDDVLYSMEAIEASAGRVKEAEDALKTEEGRLEGLKKKLDLEVDEAKDGLRNMKEDRSALTKGLDEDTFKLYMDILANKGGSAVVKVEDSVCDGCNENIMPQLVVEIAKNEKIIHCPQCRRILYQEVEETSEVSDGTQD
jgi:hypothetical protein